MGGQGGRGQDIRMRTMIESEKKDRQGLRRREAIVSYLRRKRGNLPRQWNGKEGKVTTIPSCRRKGGGPCRSRA